MKFNESNLRKVQQVILRNPEEFDMKHGLVRTRCGTAACIAGVASQLFLDSLRKVDYFPKAKEFDLDFEIPSTVLEGEKSELIETAGYLEDEIREVLEYVSFPPQERITEFETPFCPWRSIKFLGRGYLDLYEDEADLLFHFNKGLSANEEEYIVDEDDPLYAALDNCAREYNLASTKEERSRVTSLFIDEFIEFIKRRRSP